MTNTFKEYVQRVTKRLARVEDTAGKNEEQITALQNQLQLLRERVESLEAALEEPFALDETLDDTSEEDSEDTTEDATYDSEPDQLIDYFKKLRGNNV